MLNEEGDKFSNKAQEQTMYVEGNGRHQKKYDKFYDKLVPPNGPCMTLQGEILRAITYVYKKYYNERIFIDCSNAVGNVWGFLHGASQYSDHPRLNEIKKRCEELIDELPFTKAFDKTLESLFDACVLFSSSEPIIEIDDDMFNDQYKEIYMKYADYSTPFDENVKVLELVH